MKAKKAILPILASALVLSMGLVACNKPAQSNNPGGNTTSEVEEAKSSSPPQVIRKKFKLVKHYN